MGKQTVSATIDEGLLERLNRLCEIAERKRSWFIEKAIEAYLEELEDMQIARERLDDERVTPTSLRKSIGV